ncbi:hypothetical protein F5X71_02625 [Nocardia brasiliensis]|uniref:DUF4149 domain-containing protein n=1 Tax=Nocardia brasiliensis TaxID=37326 RepID=A0A6G9XK93_NOCBR|nr:hypothetical protein [Nocardia brasiliensis]QIS01351.1 hypothetical protein F5X71_02625 [Nocardia brasiliensis]
MTDTAFSAPPRAVQVAFAGFATALLAGVGEGLLRAATVLQRDFADLTNVASGLAMRLTIYSVVLLVAFRMSAGARWARLALTIGIGVLGLASLLIEPLAALLSADEFGELFAHLTAESVALGLLRAIHVVAVLIAIPAMYRPAARSYFRRRTG